MKSYLIVKYKMLMSTVTEFLRRFWAAYVVLLVLILYMGYVPNSPSKVEGLIVLSLTSVALFIWGIINRPRERYTGIPDINWLSISFLIFAIIFVFFLAANGPIEYPCNNL
ncbi:hypothetical protein ES703_74450 [subsurface metagenome]